MSAFRQVRISTLGESISLSVRSLVTIGVTMGAMSTTAIKDLPPRLRDRYGYRPTPWWVFVLAAAACIVIATLGGMVAYRDANPDVTSKLLAYNTVDSSHTSVTFEVRRDGSQTVTCALRAQNMQHHDVGYAIVTVPPGSDYVQQTYQLATREKAFTADVLACALPNDLHADQPDFPPGTSNPPQPWRPQ